jgi:hypothetical protein
MLPVFSDIFGHKAVNVADALGQLESGIPCVVWIVGILGNGTGAIRTRDLALRRR